MKLASPFTTSRFEYESRHVYYLPSELFLQLEEAKPVYLIGSRGTGKTTLLKALNWDERLHNSTLKRQLDGNAFGARYIGVYLKAPEYQFEEFDAWLGDASRQTHGSIIGFFFDLVWIELLATAIAELTVHNVIKVTPEQEHTKMADIAGLSNNVLTPLLPSKRPYTLRDLSRACARASTEWQRLAKARPNPVSLIEQFPVGQAGSFGRSVAKILGQLCDEGSVGDSRWHFKVCVDESETLQPVQQTVINTIVRLAEWPLFPVVSFVSLPADYVNTLSRSLTLQKADRNLRILDDMSDAQFRDLAEGVARVRVRHYLHKRDACFDLRLLLGSWNVNLLLESMLKGSADPGAAALLSRAADLATHAFFSQKETQDHSDPSNKERLLPIYQAYLIDRLGLSVPSPDDAHWQRRGQESAELRKGIAAAYLSICKEFGLDVRYASADVLLQLSDNCTRDFLAQLETIYRSTGQSVADFLQLRIPYSAQTGPLRDASLEKSKSLVKFGVRAPTEAGRLVDGLARVTAIIQTTGNSYQHLKSTERGIFELDIEEAKARKLLNYVTLIVDAAEAGFLRLYEPDSRVLRFRVHTSLAAAYGFSYRGAYYPARLGWSDIVRITEADNEDAHDRAISEIGRRLAGQEIDDLPLFTPRTSANE